MKYLYFTLILLLSVSFTKAQSGLELLEGKYQSQEGDGFKTREIKKKGDGFMETVIYEDEKGNVTYKFEAEFDVQQIGDESNLFIFLGKRNRSYSGDDFLKKEEWTDMNGYSHMIEVDEDFLYESEVLSSGTGGTGTNSLPYTYQRINDQYPVLSPSKLSPLNIMEGTWEGETLWGYTKMKFSFNNSRTVVTSTWDFKNEQGEFVNMNTTIYGFDISKKKITGRIFNTSGFQIDVELTNAVEGNILVFTENGTELNGGKYQCLTTFDFSEEGKLTWTAADRTSQLGPDPEDASFTLTKK
ncbi:MAG: hypothetical protein CBB92_14505 [Flammeovirgaceae bacterium TMED32]|nr:MAG: hypothetical protein CBB92_14505 [Flammeovirgaceae bacterium TMED32]